MLLDNIKWLGHSGFKITGSKTVYIDPFKINDDEPADIIIATHEHFDHLSVEDIKKIKTGDTVIITTKDCFSKVSGNVRTIDIGQTLEVDGIKIEAVPAYNLNKEFHPKHNKWMGVVLTIDERRIYHAGDTDNIPEMSNLKNIDIALLPVSGTYVMTAEEAANAANMIKPKVAIPMHYGSIVGTALDAEKFQELCLCKVVIMKH